MDHKPRIVITDRLDTIFDILTAGVMTSQTSAACQEASAAIVRLKLEIEHRVMDADEPLDIALTARGGEDA